MSDSAFRRLRDAIISGELEPGEPLRDFEIAQTLGTSKTPIRHALDRLHDYGLVEVQRNRYSRVAALDASQAREALRVFGDAWAGAVRRTPSTLQDDDQAKPSAITTEMRAATSSRDIRAFSGSLFALATRYSTLDRPADVVNEDDVRLGTVSTEREGMELIASWVP